MFNPTGKAQLFGDLLNQFRSNTKPQFNPNNYGTRNLGLLNQNQTGNFMGFDPVREAQEKAQKQAMLESILKRKEEMKMIFESPENPIFNTIYGATTGSDLEFAFPRERSMGIYGAPEYPMIRMH